MPSDTPLETGDHQPPEESGDLSGISELFGLGTGRANPGSAGAAAENGTDTVGRWVAATEGTVYGSGDSSGRLIHHRYRLIAELGSGGMGVTYRAWDTRGHVPVVIKMPKREVRHDRDVMTRFTREIEAMRAVPHPAIVPITDSGDDSGCPFVAMRFLPGGSLADYRRRDESDRPIKNPPGMLHFWLPGVAAALDHIHARGMLHRDVKPGNIFLDGFLKPALGDFGIAKVVDDSGGLSKKQTLTATKMAVGTPEYMAPELFKPRSQLDGRVDQYSLAVTVYEMLCGEKPFTGSTAHIIVEHSSAPVPPLERRCAGLPQSVYDAVHRALAKRPEERFATCGEFAAAVLEQLPPLTQEADTVRLLCPSCKNILKLPSRAAGKSGKCPRCQSVMDVAADLGSLWLESEERGGGIEAGADSHRPVTLPQEESRAAGSGRWPLRPAWIAALAACLGLAVGYAAFALRAQARVRTDFAYPVVLADETDSITSLSAEQARRYVEKAKAERSPRLSFDAVTSLSAGAARELAKFRSGGELSLDGLQTLTPEIAQELGAFEGWKLTLNGLKTLPTECVPLLSPSSTYSQRYEFNGLTSLSPELAAALGKISGLILDGLTSIDQNTAELLTNFSLSLGGLTALTADTARQLAKRSELTVSVGGNLTAEVAAALAPRDPQGKEPAPGSSFSLELKNVGSLSAAAAAALPKNVYLTLHAARLDADAATALMADRKTRYNVSLADRETQYNVSLSGPVDLTPAVVRLLAQQSRFVLRANTIRDDVAEALSESQDERSCLRLELSALEPTTAGILAKSSRPLFLFLKRIPIEFAAALVDHRGPIAIESSEGYDDNSPLRCSPAALAILKSSGAIRPPIGSFSPLSFVFTWCATGFHRSILHFLWGAFFVGLIGLLFCRVRLRRLGRQAGGDSSAATALSVSATARTAWYATAMGGASLVLIEFIVTRYVLPWHRFWRYEMGLEMPEYFYGKCLAFLLLPLAGLWLLLSVACGRQSRRAWGQVKTFSVVGESKRRFLWWCGVVALFFMLFAYDYSRPSLVKHGSFNAWERDPYVSVVNQFRDNLFGYGRSDDGRVRAMLLCLLAMATYSLLRPGSRWVLAIANVILTAMIVSVAWLVPHMMHCRSNDLPLPGGFGLLTVAWAIPLVAGWLLARAGWFMVTLFASPRGGTPYHVCSSDGVAVESAWVVPWSGFSAYEWDDDRLVLHRAGRLALSKTLSGTVPVEERAAAEALLASRLPKAGGRGTP